VCAADLAAQQLSDSIEGFETLISLCILLKTDLPAKQCQTYLKFKHVNHRDVIHLNTLYLIDSTEAYLSEILVIYKINVVVLLCFLLTSK